MINSPEAIVNILMIFILILFTILLFHIGRHTKSNVYLAVYFISQIIGITNFTGILPYKMFFFIAQPICYTWGALFYMFVSSMLESSFRFRLRYILHFVPAAIVCIFLVFRFSMESRMNQDLFFAWIIKNEVLILNILFNFLIIGYNIAAFYIYFKYRSRQKKDPSLRITVPDMWLKIALFGFAISCIIVQIDKISFQSPVNKYLIGNIAFLLYFCALFYVAIVSRTLTNKFEIIEKYRNSPLSDLDAQKLLELLERHMIADKPFTDPDVSLKSMSTSLKIPEKHLSQIINKYKNQNFSEYMNYHRVQHAMELLKDPVHKDKTIFWVLFEAGFNSKAAFNTSFKKIAGCTPIEFKKKELVK